ncbi:MAG TPA: CDP-alcohol phosphatidyltransferase family protein [Afifellaceae bacterium]|nr:CDP-alcohol phosphatidyltransferase family protein [Afifellaceae bacterium]
MLDGKARQLIDPALDRMGSALAAGGVNANAVTGAGLVTGIAAALVIAFEAYLAGLILLMISRLADGLDGAIARHSRTTDLGGYLDIVSDFTFYGAIPLGFVFADPAANAVAGAVLLLSFYVNGSSFLAFAIMAEKQGLTTIARGSKSLYFTTGLAEGTETIAVFCAFCLFPSAFALIAYVFAAICFITAGARVLLAMKTFR